MLLMKPYTIRLLVYYLIVWITRINYLWMKKYMNAYKSNYYNSNETQMRVKSLFLKYL